MKLRCWSIVPAFLLAACGSGQGEGAAPMPVEGQAADIAPEQEAMGPERRILAFGNSLFAGYNVAPEDSYPARLQAALQARGVNARVTNAGVSGDTTAAGRQRLAFTLDAQGDPPDLVVLELGGNDLLRSISPDQTRENLAAMVEEIQGRGIRILLMGMRAPPNLGPEFVRSFDAIYPALAEQYDLELVPFFLEPVYDQPQMIQPDRIHPNEKGIEALVDASVDAVAQALPPAG